MIVEALWGMVTGLVAGLFSLIPSWNVDTSAVSTALGAIGSMGSLGDGYFPVTLMCICLGIVLGTKIVLDVWNLVVFLYELIPFKMT